MSLRVLISGAGLGGLTLAHGLRAAGIEPLLFERGPRDVDLSGSFRIHIDGNGSRALHACLPAALWHRFEQHSAASPRGIEFVTERLRHLAFIAEAQPPNAPFAHSHPISRSGLRQLLLEGLEDAIRFDQRVVGYEQPSANEVVVRFADGSTASGDVLVGADGSASPIRKQLLPDARVVDTGVGGIAGKAYLNDAVREAIGRRWLSQMTMVLPARGMAFFMAPFLRRPDLPEPEAQLDMPEHLFWVVIGRAEAFGGFDDSERSHAQLQQQALRMVSGWHPLLGDLVRRAATETLIGVPLYTAESVAAWQPGRVTLLGDAIHTMTPLQGLGGNTALVDAANLCQRLIEVERGRAELREAIGRYEASMRGYGFEAVQRSLQVSNSVASTNAFGRLAFRGVLSAVDRVPALRDAMFRRQEMEIARAA